MVKRVSKRIAIVLAMFMFLTGVTSTLSVNAASTADMKKANVSWDLKNNKTLKFKTKWYALGTKTHTVKMTNYKVTKASKKGYLKCTFTLTYNVNIKPTKKQVDKMGTKFDEIGTFGGGYYYTVVDYKTGKSLEGENDKDVTVTDSGWKHSNYVKKYGTGSGADRAWIRYAKKSKVNVKIIYPEKYKNLAIGVGGYSAYNIYSSSIESFWAGNRSYSKTTKLYSKKDKKFAHFRRVK